MFSKVVLMSLLGQETVLCIPNGVDNSAETKVLLAGPSVAPAELKPPHKGRGISHLRLRDSAHKGRIKQSEVDGTKLSTQHSALNTEFGEYRVVSPLRIPIPVGEYTQTPVVVYFYSDRWIPITCFCLAEAIALYRKALSLGKKILVYPPDLDETTQIWSEKSLEVAQ